MKKSIKYLFVFLVYILLTMNVYGLKIILLWDIVLPIGFILEYLTEDYENKIEINRM